MDLLQVGQQTAPLPLLGTALLLGLRHGIDWDHIAAIMDVASTATTAEVAEETTHRHGPAAHARGDPTAHHFTFGHVQRRALWLSLLYALGHATMVVALGLLALTFASLLPDWIDPLMERIVGATLLLLGAWVLYSLAVYLRGGPEFRLYSRWMVVFALVRYGFNWLRARARGHEHQVHMQVHQYGAGTAYAVGMIHGIGAETGTQVLLLAAIGGASTQGLGLGMLLSFVLGLLITNTLIAALASTGYITSAGARPVYVAIGLLTGVFSLAVGALFMFGLGADLPDLSEAFSFLGGEE